MIEIKTVRYGWANNPHQGRIKKMVKKMDKKGYALQSRTEHKIGCVALVLTLYWGRGKTELTFIKKDSD